MASALSSLGLGSKGALNYDIIDQLKKVDEETQIKPIDNKIEKNTTKYNDLSTLTTLTASLKSMTSSLSSENSYLQRSTTVNGDSVSVNAAAGTTIQDFTLDVTTLAQNDIYESKSFTELSSTFTDGADTIKFSIDGETYDIDVNASTTISELKDEIFDKTDGKISASILNVGGDEPYKLIIKSTATGADNAISISSSNGAALNLEIANYTYTADTPSGSYAAGGNGDDTLRFSIDGTDYDITVEDGDSITDIANKITLNHDNVLKATVVDGKLQLESLDGEIGISSTYGSDTLFGLNNISTTQDSHIQTAKDASFKFNGVEITRDSNSFDDLVTGISVTLKETGTSSVSITQDTTQIKDDVESFVSKYNELLNNLNEVLKYDSDSKDAGTFQGVNQITTLKTDINRQLLSVDEDGNSLSQYGVELNSNGVLEFDEDKFNSKMRSDPSGLENFFRGYTTIDSTQISGNVINTGAIDITSGDFAINDTNIVVSLNGTPSENAEALKIAINNANITGVEAELNSDGTGINIISGAGFDINISGDKNVLNSIGLRESSVYGSSEKTDGYFAKFNSLLADYTIGDEAILNLYSAQLQDRESSLVEERKKTVSRLDTQYQLMATKFAAYDAIIGQLNAQFNSLSMMIESETNSKS